MRKQFKKLLLAVIIAFMVSSFQVGRMTDTATESRHDTFHGDYLFSSSNHSHNREIDVFNDILDGSTGQSYNLEEEYWASMGSTHIMPMASQQLRRQKPSLR